MTLSAQLGNNYQSRLVNLYKNIYKARMGEYPAIEYKIFAPMLKRLVAKYGEPLVAAGMLMHFEQYNPSIEEGGFQPTWIARAMDKYIGQLQEKGVNIDSEEEVLSAVQSRLDFLEIKLKVC